MEVGTRTTVTVDAVVYDWRTSEPGCSPDGCTPESTRDGSLDWESRWSCKVNIIEGNGGCRIYYHFEEPQDVTNVRIAFHKGDERVLPLNIFVDDGFHSRIESSGITSSFEEFDLATAGASDITLYHADYGSYSSDTWVSLTEVRGAVRLVLVASKHI